MQRPRDDAAGSGFVPRRAGGSRQRAAHAEEARCANLKTSVLATYLLQLWSWGLMSPQQLQSIMAKMKEDLEAHANRELDVREVDRLASIGTSGKWTNNMHHDLVQLLHPPAIQQATCVFEVPLKTKPWPSTGFSILNHIVIVTLGPVLFIPL